ncbi:glycoside hydrolase, partial [Marivirga lumbricoides]
YDGFAWYRIHFDGTTLNQSELYFLVLGFIDDVDETYINGKLIGKSGSFPPRNRTAYNSHRSYSIPSEAINFKGDNVIAVRVFDEMGSGGIVAGEIGLYTLKKLNSSQMLQNLYGVWKFNKFNKSGFENPELDDSGWEDILAPAYWDNHGYKTLDGTAWYRKHFTLSFKQKPGK